MTCSFLASAIFSFSGLCVKLTTGRVPVLEVCFIRSALSFGLTQLLMQAIGMPARQFFGQRPNLKLLLLRGCCGACSMVRVACGCWERGRASGAPPLTVTLCLFFLQTTYYIALFLLPLADAVTINVVGPPVTVLFARLLLKEPLGCVSCVLAQDGCMHCTLADQPAS
jgi:drug/metabolite transporter (DMT)-like permease